jgi:septin family protein
MKDTPGISYPEDLWQVRDKILHFLNERIQLEDDPDPVGPLDAYPDNRFDVCLYFISADTWGQDHLQNIAHLSEHVPVIPLVGKVTATQWTTM